MIIKANLIVLIVHFFFLNRDKGNIHPTKTTKQNISRIIVHDISLRLGRVLSSFFELI